MKDAYKDSLIAGSIAALVGGIPSTVHAVISGSDPLQGARAAGAIVGTSGLLLLAVAAMVHLVISLFWSLVVTFALPRDRVFPLAILAAVAIGVLDLRVIGRLFPEIYALAFWPQMADHIVWGATVGFVLDYRYHRPVRAAHGQVDHSSVG